MIYVQYNFIVLIQPIKGGCMQLPIGKKSSLSKLLLAPSTECYSTDGLPASPGVYLWTFVNDRGETIFYVGRSKNLRSRILVHMDLMFGSRVNIGTSPKHSRAAVKYRDTAQVYVLELFQGEPSKKDTLASLERFWILYFWKTFGASRLLNVEVVPNNRRFSAATSARMSKLHRERFVKDPDAREFMANKVRAQWEDPEFRQVNTKRLEDLRSTGWAPTKEILYKVKLPNKTKYLVPRKVLVEYLGIGCRTNGFLSFFSENDLLSDWTVTEHLRVSGKEMLGLRDKILIESQRFLSDPFICWFREFKDRLKTGSRWSRATPIKFMSNTGPQKTLFTTSFRKSGKTLVDGGILLSRYKTIYEFAKDRTPIYYG